MPRIAVTRLDRCLAGVPAAILAGGLGTRLLPALPDTPKVLAPVHGRPFLAYVLDQLADAALRQIILLTCFRADDVEAAFGRRHGPCRLDYSREPAPLGTGGALRHALPLLAGPTILLMNGDSYCPADLTALHALHRRHRADLSMVVVRVNDARRFGRVLFKEDGVVTGFDEKTADAAPGWINAGICLIERRLVADIPSGKVVSLERDWLPAWISRKRVLAFPSTAPFLDIGTPESYRTAAAFFARMMQQRERNAQPA